MSPFTIDLLALLAAIPLAGLGGELFLKGVLGLAGWLRLPKLLVASTLSAFATSSPELTVSTMAALAGKPEIGLGDALGSNVVNIALILGLALLFGPLTAGGRELRRDMGLALGVPVLTLLLTADGALSRADGSLLLTLFALWLLVVARQVIVHRRGTDQDEGPPGRSIRSWLSALVGLVCLILAGRLFVTGASGIASTLGIHPYVIGATVVAAGTSLPELVTTLLSRWHGHDDVGLGTVLGSNLFNGLAIVGIAASICPVRAHFSDVAVALGFGALTVLMILPRGETISRNRGLALLSVYIAYVAVTFIF